MSVEMASVKSEANFPAAHPYWAGLLFGVATFPVFIVLSEPLAQQWGALLLAMIGGAYIGFAAPGRPAEREHHRAGRRPGFRRHRACRPAAQSAIDRRRICGPWLLGSLSSPPRPLRRHAALVHPLLRRVRLDPWGVLAGLVVVKLVRVPFARAGAEL